MSSIAYYPKTCPNFWLLPALPNFVLPWCCVLCCVLYSGFGDLSCFETNQIVCPSMSKSFLKVLLDAKSMSPRWVHIDGAAGWMIHMDMANSMWLRLHSDPPTFLSIGRKNWCLSWSSAICGWHIWLRALWIGNVAIDRANWSLWELTWVYYSAQGILYRMTFMQIYSNHLQPSQPFDHHVADPWEHAQAVGWLIDRC